MLLRVQQNRNLKVRLNMTNQFIACNQDNFDDEVRAADGGVLVKFGADWCAPCKALETVLTHMPEMANVKMVTVDVEDSPGLAQQHAVRTLPSVVVYVDGQMRESSIGMLQRHQIKALLKSAGVRPDAAAQPSMS